MTARALARSVGGSTFMSASGTVASYALTIILAREGGAASFGSYMLCMAWAAIITVMIDCASDAAFTHLAVERGDPHHAFDTVMTARLMVFLLLALTLGGMASVGLINMPWQTVVFLLPAFNFGILFEFQRRNVQFAAIICIEKVALLATNAALLIVLDFSQAVYIAYGTVSAVSVLAQAYAQRTYVRGFRRAAASAIGTYAITYWPLMLIALAQLGYGHLSRLIVEGKKGVAVFASVSLAFQVIALASILQTQVDRSFRPPIIEAVRSRDPKALRRLVRNYLMFATLPMVIGALLLFATAPLLMQTVFGREYELAGSVLRQISPLFISISLMRLTDLMLLALDQIKQSMAINVTSSILMLLVMLCVPASKPLSLLMGIVVAAQYVQAALSGVLVIRALHRRSA